MSDYEPINLSKLSNADSSIVNEEVLLGNQKLRGLPFLVGDENSKSTDKCFICLSAGDSPVEIPIKKHASRIIIAHRLIESSIPDGGELGVQVAEYVFRKSDGSEDRVSIRELFEIGYVPSRVQESPWRVYGFPSRAFADQKAKLLPRYEGDFELVGRRQTEAAPAEATLYYLWSWENKDRDSEIESLQIVPNGPRFIVAAITLGHLDEEPFAREGRRPVRITLNDEKDAKQPFNLDVEVDRGDSTYAYPLPQDDSEAFLEDYYKGWGQEQNPSSSPSYVEITATPSATVVVKQDNQELSSVKWGDLEKDGVVETPKMRVELLEDGKNWVHVTVLDEDTGKPVPCRVHFRSPEGVPYQPHGHHNHVNSNLDTWHIDVGGDMRLGQITYAYIDGTCQGWLPRGDVIVDVARGFEYEPLRAKVNISPGQRELTLRINRWTDMNSQGWFSGDSHVHFLNPQGAHTESQGEDLDVVNLLQSQWGSLFTNTEDFTGEPSVSRDGSSIVYVSQENRQHFMGHMILWGLKKPVMPWCSDGLGEAEIGGTMETALSYWADEAHAQGGYVINPHFPFPNGEPAALVATGRLDGIEMIRQGPQDHLEYYRYLNCGYRLPLVGGTDKMSSDVPVGLYRTYAKLGQDQEFNYDNWCKSVASGKTFLSGGPIIHLTVDGYEVGDTISISGPGTLEVEAWAESVMPIEKLEIVQAGRVVASTQVKGGTRRLEIKEKLKIDGHSWIAARCGGPDYFGRQHLDVWNRGIFAHTSPVYVACSGDWWMYDESTAQYMLTLLEVDLAYIREGSGQHTHGNVTHHHGQSDHIAYLEKPFLEAQSAIKERVKNSR